MNGFLYPFLKVEAKWHRYSVEDVQTHENGSLNDAKLSEHPSGRREAAATGTFASFGFSRLPFWTYSTTMPMQFWLHFLRRGEACHVMKIVSDVSLLQ